MKDFATHVIGDGAVGTTVAISLSMVGTVYLHGRTGPVSGNLVLLNQDQTLTAKFELPPSTPDSKGLFIFAVKAFDLEKSVAQYLPLMAAGSTMLVLCNGYIDPEIKKLSSLYSKFHWHRGVVVFGASKQSEDVCRLHTVQPKVYFALGEYEHMLSCHLQSSSLFSRSENILRDIQMKLFANLVMNTLTAAYNLTTNEEVWLHQNELQLLMEESFDLLGVLYPADVRATKAEFQAYLKAVLTLTKGNTNSMVVDLRSKRPMELDYLSGIVSNLTGYSMLKKLHGQILDSKT